MLPAPHLRSRGGRSRYRHLTLVGGELGIRRGLHVLESGILECLKLQERLRDGAASSGTS